MRLSATLLALLLALVPFAGPAAELSFGQEGVEIDAGSIGKFTLEYPKFSDANYQEIHKLVQKNLTGKTAALKYEGGAQLDLTLATNGKLLLKFAHVPADVKTFQADLFIPFSFNQGGSWQMGDKEAPFPQEKPAKPHLFQGGTTTFRIRNYEGKSLVIQVPEYSFLQLSDNREWNWPIFQWRSFTPFDPNRLEVAFTISTEGPAAGSKSKPLVDQFGQLTSSDWPDKVKSLDELKSDVTAEQAYYANLHPPQLGPFGGLPGSKEKLGLKATGFFHVEKKNDRWLLVDPAGQVFFHLGLCAVSPSDDYTVTKGRESAYEWLPAPDGEFKTAFFKDQAGPPVSFHLVNQIRKYGQPYSNAAYTGRMIERMRKWGFNSVGAFSGSDETTRKQTQFPSVAHLPLSSWEGIPRIPGIQETFDPFDPNNRATVEANLARALPARANDPLIIGYFIVNEPLYENIAKVVPSLKGNAACKLRLVQLLKDKYHTIEAFNTAWGAQAKSFDDLNDAGLAVKTEASQNDIHEFTGLFLDEYFKLITEAFRRHDSHHLLIGSRLQPGTIKSEQLCRIAGKYLDVMSFNYYTYGVDKELLQRIYHWTGDRPMMLSEFYWSSPKDSGLTGGSEVASQQQRGLAYRNYVEQSAALGFVIGIEWFTLIDQSATGRWFEGFNGERANTGVLSVTDRPWKPMLAEVMKTNYEIYQVLFGDRKPFVFDNPKFNPAH